ncbi:DsbA family protein [Granulicella arctica]|uniref:DsbA family protein n=1 Tax=Granulicella arctica TaxID=940613 RepID=UPI0021DF551D|nr:DsbA family protein [Granulicella arctica]
MSMLKVPVTDDDHSLGDAKAKITLVEYGDYQCPDAGMAYPMVKKLQKHYGKEMRFVFRNFPLADIHEMAEPAAQLAEFAAAQGKFWQMHDALFAHQRRLRPSMLVKLTEQLGLDGNDAASAIEDHEFAKRIATDVDGGKRSGVHGTPTFFINGNLYEGEWKYEELMAAIEAA